MKRLLLALLISSAPFVSHAADSTCVKFDFKSTTDLSGTYTGSLQSGATLTTFAGEPVLSLGNNNGYFDLGTAIGNYLGSMNEYTIVVNVFIPTSTDISGNGNFIWCFAKSSAEGYYFFSAKDSRYAITTTNWSNEESVKTEESPAFTKGKWINLLVMHKNGRTRVLQDCKIFANSLVSLAPASVGATTMNYLGKSCYSGDVYLKGAMYNDLRIYNYALSTAEIRQFKQSCTAMNIYADSVANMAEIQSFTFSNYTNLIEDITLPKTFGDSTRITWTTSDAGVITADGHITRPVYGSKIGEADLTAHLVAGKAKGTMTFHVTVLPEFSDEETLAFDADSLTLNAHLNNLYTSLSLPTTGMLGSIITWKSSDPEYMTNDGRVLKFSDTEKRHLRLTATLHRGKLSKTKTFDVYLHKKENYSQYLFVYFPSNSDENLYYAISDDGYNYTPINNGNAFFKADTTTVMGGLRDPHILRGEDGYFYMVATDMKCALGWSSNRGMVLMRSKDLIHWTHSTVHFPTRFAGTEFANVTRVWAPETIWDPVAKKYLIYFSILTPNGSAKYDKVYYCYANADFTDLESEPVYFYDRGSATIDMDIVYNETDSLYHAFYKNEGQGGICQVTAKSLTPKAGEANGSQWSAPSSTLQQTNVAVEGAGVFKKINEDNWILMYDCYGSGYYQFCSSSNLNSFKLVAQTTTKGAFTPRHGTVIPISNAEAKAIMQALPNDNMPAKVLSANNVNIKQTNYALSSGAIYIPVEQGTDIAEFDPEFRVSAGAQMQPSGAQDFSKGSVTYTLTSATGATTTYNVTVKADGNPVLPDFHADPEVLCSKKTGRFYIYPTTDGFTGWGGYYFDVFSSNDLVHFSNQGTILNLAAGGDVSWASGNAWAPCIEEKFVDGKWKYFFYYSAHHPGLNKKILGVAVAENPEGPFTPMQRPLFTNTSGGQMIDSDVFTDPETGQSYLYYGNGLMHYRLLNDDMVSVGSTEYTITPTGGSLADYAYREGTYVFYRNGKYYFLWSVDDTGAKNYHVAYGTSNTPVGPITVADKPIVIVQKANEQIYGTGHNSIVNVPGTDDWYIVYHRINKAYLNDGPGYHREVCVDKLTFDSLGNIVQVTPTHEGITPVNTDALVQDAINGVTDIKAPKSRKLSKTVYYTIDGVCLGAKAPTHDGIYIRQEIFTDGSTRSCKIVK